MGCELVMVLKCYPTEVLKVSGHGSKIVMVLKCYPTEVLKVSVHGL